MGMLVGVVAGIVRPFPMIIEGGGVYFDVEDGRGTPLRARFSPLDVPRFDESLSTGYDVFIRFFDNPQ